MSNYISYTLSDIFETDIVTNIYLDNDKQCNVISYTLEDKNISNILSININHGSLILEKYNTVIIKPFKTDNNQTEYFNISHISEQSAKQGLSPMIFIKIYGQYNIFINNNHGQLIPEAHRPPFNKFIYTNIYDTFNGKIWTADIVDHKLKTNLTIDDLKQLKAKHISNEYINDNYIPLSSKYEDVEMFDIVTSGKYDVIKGNYAYINGKLSLFNIIVLL